MMNIDINNLVRVTGGKGTGSAGGLVHSRGAQPVNPATPYEPLDWSEYYRNGGRG